MDYDSETTVDEERPEGERDAFMLWANECDRKQKCVHEKTGVPLRTLYFWQKRWLWKVEADEDLAIVLQLLQDRGKEGFATLLSKAAQRLGKMLDDDEVDHREQRENIRLLAMVANLTQADGPNTLIDARSVTLQGQHANDPAIAMRRATNILEANVASSNNERRQSRRKTF